MMLMRMDKAKLGRVIYEWVTSHGLWTDSAGNPVDLPLDRATLADDLIAFLAQRGFVVVREDDRG